MVGTPCQQEMCPLRLHQSNISMQKHLRSLKTWREEMGFPDIPAFQFLDEGTLASPIKFSKYDAQLILYFIERIVCPSDEEERVHFFCLYFFPSVLNFYISSFPKTIHSHRWKEMLSRSSLSNFIISTSWVPFGLNRSLPWSHSTLVFRRRHCHCTHPSAYFYFVIPYSSEGF